MRVPLTALMVALACAGCGRTEVYPRRILKPDPCEKLGTQRPCMTACGAGTEFCVDGFWVGCTAPAPLSPPEAIAIEGTLRDFHQSHPDFEHLVGDDRGIVGQTLGPDATPLYPHSGGTKTVTGPDTFAQWFHDAKGTNAALATALSLKRVSAAPLIYSFSDEAFFPLDGQLFGNEGNAHNFHFTLELHTEVEYRGGETLFFEGDDDLWVFVNHALVIDLGGPHPTQSASIGLDFLGLTRGGIYPLDVFFAERHTSHSSLRIETTNARFLQCPK